MKLKIAVLEGDGIGPEIMKQGVAVLDAIAEKFGHEFIYHPAICGAHAIEEVGDPYPDATHDVCMQADAVLFAAVGSLKFDNDPTAKIRPETGLLAMRKKEVGPLCKCSPCGYFLLSAAQVATEGGTAARSRLCSHPRTHRRYVFWCEISG